jgi:NADPH:quinone reductase-like Zn-dependent oxidoreductase
VEAVAPGVTVVKPGEAVYGLCSFNRNGSAAEYLAVQADGLARKPKTLDPVAAASVPLAALTAWQAFFDRAQLGKGQRVLIHGGAGGVGIFAVQLANWAGARVITTASTRNREFLIELGAHEVIDYTKTRFEDEVSNADLVLDTVGGETLDRSWGVLKRGGALVSVVQPVDAEKAKAAGVRGVFFIVEPNRTQLIELGGLIDTGKLRTHVDKVLPLSEARQAIEYGLEGHARGKIVLRVVAEG